jgi:hypothetical protein
LDSQKNYPPLTRKIGWDKVPSAKIGEVGGNDAYSGPGTGDVFFHGNTGEAADEPVFTELSQRRHVCGIFSVRYR